MTDDLEEDIDILQEQQEKARIIQADSIHDAHPWLMAREWACYATLGASTPMISYEWSNHRPQTTTTQTTERFMGYGTKWNDAARSLKPAHCPSLRSNDLNSSHTQRSSHGYHILHDQTIWAEEYESGLVWAMAAFGREKDSWLGPNVCPQSLSHVIKIARLMVIQYAL
ncbi:hypothetical protein BJX66DRAFT_342684 [Aspergillus keveii]|uniref:Uncharacterized protein n=1 Tax=Aspergillus keveii TaxID=714993 RepID=A0ABR4FRH0_9EURO